MDRQRPGLLLYSLSVLQHLIRLSVMRRLCLRLRLLSTLSTGMLRLLLPFWSDFLTLTRRRGGRSVYAMPHLSESIVNKKSGLISR